MCDYCNIGAACWVGALEQDQSKFLHVRDCWYIKRNLHACIFGTFRTCTHVVRN